MTRSHSGRRALLALVAALTFTAAAEARPRPGGGQTQPARARASDGPARVEEGYVTAGDGARLFYQKAGRGRRAVVIPGRLFLFEYLRPLADRYTVISYDMRNRGRSDAVADATRITIQDDVRDLETVRRHFGLKKFDLVGYSYLGMMVMLYTAEHPEYVRRLVQFGPVPLRYGTQYPAHLTAGGGDVGGDPAERERVRALRERGLDKSSPKEFCEARWAVDRDWLVGDPANVGKLGAGWCDMPNEWPVNLGRHLGHHFASVQKLDVPWEDLVERVTHPVLTVHGTRDRNAPYGAGREWAMRLRGARLLAVEGAAHQLFAERPEVVLPAVRAFLGGKWPAGAQRVTQVDEGGPASSSTRYGEPPAPRRIS